MNERLLFLLQERKAGALVLGNFITSGKRIEGALFGFSTEIVESHFLTAAKFLEAMMKEVGFTAFLADDAECHDVGSFRLLGVDAVGELNESGLRECGVSAVLRNSLQGAGSDLDGHELLEFRHPDALGAKVGRKVAGCHGGDVHADAALLLGETSAVDLGAADGTRTCDRALSGHNKIC